VFEGHVGEADIQVASSIAFARAIRARGEGRTQGLGEIRSWLVESEHLIGLPDAGTLISEGSTCPSLCRTVRCEVPERVLRRSCPGVSQVERSRAPSSMV
jgi:hypothetical protein